MGEKNKKRETISILGCGWLGLPLAEKLIAEGFSVNGSTTSTAKIPILESVGITAFLISAGEDEVHGNITDFLAESEILILDIPPKLRGEKKEDFVVKIKNLLPYIEKSGIKKVLFVSSISVYADENGTVTENTTPKPNTESGRQLLEVEKMLQNNPNFKATVLRFGGLIGANRNPVKYLAGKENLENPDAPINMIHLEDCIGIILRIIEKHSFGEIFNAVSPFHPSRSEFYIGKATEMNLALLTFASDKSSVGKLVSSEKIEKVLKYSFIKSKL
ncbi:SDR family oxidoreductase [Flavobacterium sp.]|uniref:SDR family oxidoreductase n=1 Tax=Flavobacterium sp. TaxID=239 RepID=UPI003D6C57D1